jgi:hypothetical protein
MNDWENASGAVNIKPRAAIVIGFSVFALSIVALSTPCRTFSSEHE